MYMYFQLSNDIANRRRLLPMLQIIFEIWFFPIFSFINRISVACTHWEVVVSQFRNFGIFLTLKFYVKSILAKFQITQDH